MTFTEKLAKLTIDAGTKKRVAESAGLQASAISNYITRKQMPRGDKALSLARALKVPVDWLLDDKQGWPPPENNEDAVAISLTDGALMAEIMRRVHLERGDMLEKLEGLEKVEWQLADKVLCDTPKDKPLPRDLVSIGLRVHSLVLSQLNSARKYELQTYEPLFDRLPLPPGRTLDELDLKKLNDRFYRLCNGWEFRCFVKHLMARAGDMTEEARKLSSIPALFKLAAGDAGLADMTIPNQTDPPKPKVTPRKPLRHPFNPNSDIKK